MILLDSHVVIWLAFDQDRISITASSAMSAAQVANQRLAICGITLLELAQAAIRGRIEIDMSVESFLDDIESRFVVLPITGQVAAQAVAFPSNYPKDPADRLIGATALLEGIPLITADRHIRRAKAFQTIW